MELALLFSARDSQYPARATPPQHMSWSSPHVHYFSPISQLKVRVINLNLICNRQPGHIFSGLSFKPWKSRPQNQVQSGRVPFIKQVPDKYNPVLLSCLFYIILWTSKCNFWASRTFVIKLHPAASRGIYLKPKVITVQSQHLTLFLSSSR